MDPAQQRLGQEEADLDVRRRQQGNDGAFRRHLFAQAIEGVVDHRIGRRHHPALRQPALGFGELGPVGGHDGARRIDDVLASGEPRAGDPGPGLGDPGPIGIDRAGGGVALLGGDRVARP